MKGAEVARSRCRAMRRGKRRWMLQRKRSACRRRTVARLPRRPAHRRPARRCPRRLQTPNRSNPGPASRCSCSAPSASCSRHRHQPAVRAQGGVRRGARMELTEANVLGALSLIFWTLAVVVTAKYVVLILRADNHGEGGILALLALVVRLTRGSRRLRYVLGLLGVFGATLFYGDAVITPAISVAVGGRGAGGHRAAAAPVRRAGVADGADRAVRDPGLRHRQGRRVLRAADGAVVRHPRRARHRQRRRDAGRAGGGASELRLSLLRRPPADSRSSRSAPSCSR